MTPAPAGFVGQEWSLSERSQRSVGKFISKTQAHLGMLEHVIETQVLDLIFSSMDLLVTVPKFGLDNKGRRVTVAAGGSMVRAGIAALCFDVGNIAILQGKSALVHEGRQFAIDEHTSVMISLMNSVRPLST